MTTAFVLSGGGSLGAVQVGMLQALAAWGVRPDLLIGTSAGALNAGLDLEMPGTNKWRTQEHVLRSITSMKVSRATIKERARKVLELVKRCTAENPEV